jgi:Ca2+-transporting ATPase
MHNQKKEDILLELQVTPGVGLTSQEVEKRLLQYGENRLKEKKKVSNITKFLEQFKDVMIIILLFAAAVSFGIAVMEKNTNAFFEPFLILLIVVCNAVMGVFQENKAEKSLEALMRLTSPHARVIRDGKQQIVDAKTLVPGDIIQLDAGDFIPADARLLVSSALKSEESALTGESVPSDKQAETIIEKDAPLGDRINMIYTGCSITNGTAIAVVTSTGMNSEMGKIANLLEGAQDTKTPLQITLAQLGKYLGFLALGVCAIIFVIGIVEGMDMMEMFMTAVSLAVSAIPEGLPVIVTVVLSIGVERMAKQRAVVKKLPAVETLGSTSIICSDKTGTLTQNKMTLVKAFSFEEKVNEEVTNSNSETIKQLLTYGTLCTNGSIDIKDGKEVLIGDPTETSIIVAAKENGIDKDEIFKQYQRLVELPFDSERKLMSVVCQMNDKKVVITKGAFDNIITLCNKQNLSSVASLNETWSSEALRVIAIAYKEIDSLSSKPSFEELESDLTFIGLVGMIDPPRAEAKVAVADCKKAGIKPIMITGDHVVTASAIAKQLGILEDGEMAITGVLLSKMSEEELQRDLEKISVYARVSPEDKIRIIRAWQAKDQIVSMTGDGVNDAPALKAADIGCAMGITGTDVAKGAADLTLMDDNFATIVEAVKEGRGIYSNIRKTVGFLLGTNIGEVLLVFLSMLFFREAPLLSMQLLWINLVTDSMPAIALGMENISDDVMEQKPRPKKEGIFAHGLGIQVILQGIMFGLLALFAFKYGYDHNGIVTGRTLAFMTLGLSQVLHSLNMRSNKSIFKIGIFSNKALTKALFASLTLMLMVLFVPPIATVFGLTTLPASLYGLGISLAIVPIIVLEIAKMLKLVK